MLFNYAQLHLYLDIVLENTHFILCALEEFVLSQSE